MRAGVHDAMLPRCERAPLGEPIYTGPVAAGAATTPTPTLTRLFHIRVLLRTNDSNSPYGPYAYGLSAMDNSERVPVPCFDGEG